MIVTAAMAWYAEDVEALTRCANSLAGYCNRLVALAGRWQGFPEIPDDDESDQVLALALTCTAIGLDCKIEGHDGPWSSQVEKRNALMRDASVKSDWILVIDGDEYIEEGGDPEAFREGLAATDRDVAMVYARRIPLSYARTIRRVYRSGNGSVGVVTAHNGYVTADGRFLNGDAAYAEIEEPADVSGHITIAHDLSCRSESRVAARRDYLSYRRKRRIEAWA